MGAAQRRRAGRRELASFRPVSVQVPSSWRGDWCNVGGEGGDEADLETSSRRLRVTRSGNALHLLPLCDRCSPVHALEASASLSTPCGPSCAPTMHLPSPRLQGVTSRLGTRGRASSAGQDGRRSLGSNCTSSSREMSSCCRVSPIPRHSPPSTDPFLGVAALATYDAAPNSHVATFDAALPGSLPVRPLASLLPPFSS